MYAGKPSLTCIAAWPSGKWSAVNADELHRVLEQARTGGEARTRQVGRARVVLADRAQDVRVVDAGAVGDREELVRDRELHVAPGVGEQLRQLGFLGRRPDRLAGELPEQRGRAFGGAVVVRADDLRQRVELLERVALGDPLRAERHVDPAAARRRDAGRRSRSCPGRRCSAGRPARRRGGAARSGRRPSRRSSSTARGTRRPACR